MKFSKCVIEENLLSSNHRDQVVENKTKILILMLAELQQKFKSQTLSVSVAQEH